MKRNKKLARLILVSLAVVINIVGSKISIMFGLPIFLDSIGTIMAGSILGPLYGLLTALLGGLVNGALGDIYAIYFSPSGMVMGLMAGLLYYGKRKTIVSAFWKTFLIVLPASFISALIETFLFGGITSALVTTALIQTLSHTVMSLLSSAFLIQLITDYVDKLIAVLLTFAVMKRLPGSLKGGFDGKEKGNN